MSDRKPTTMHPRPRIGKTRDDRKPPKERTRGGRQDRNKFGKPK